MALSLAEELQLLKNTEDFSGGLTDFPLSELVYQAAIGEAITFGASAKDLDASTEKNAYNYQEKVLRIAGQVSRKDAKTLDTMRKVIVAAVGDSQFTFNQANGADEDAWEKVLDGTLISGVSILKAMEITGGVLDFEKTAWNAA